MKLNRFLIVCILLLAIVSIGAVSAADATDTSTASPVGEEDLGIAEFTMNDGELLGDDGDSENINIDDEAFTDGQSFSYIELPKDSTGNVTVNLDDEEYLNKNVTDDDWHSIDHPFDSSKTVYFINTTMFKKDVVPGEHVVSVSYFEDGEDPIYHKVNTVTFYERDIVNDAMIPDVTIEFHHNEIYVGASIQIVRIWTPKDAKNKVNITLKGERTYSVERTLDNFYTDMDGERECHSIFPYDFGNIDFDDYDITLVYWIDDENNVTFESQDKIRLTGDVYEEANDKIFILQDQYAGMPFANVILPKDATGNITVFLSGSAEYSLNRNVNDDIWNSWKYNAESRCYEIDGTMFENRIDPGVYDITVSYFEDGEDSIFSKHTRITFYGSTSFANETAGLEVFFNPFVVDIAMDDMPIAMIVAPDGSTNKVNITLEGDETFSIERPIDEFGVSGIMDAHPIRVSHFENIVPGEYDLTIVFWHDDEHNETFKSNEKIKLDNHVHITDDYFYEDFIDVKVPVGLTGAIMVISFPDQTIIFSKDLADDDWNREVDDADDTMVHYLINGEMLNLGPGVYTLVAGYQSFFDQDSEFYASFGTMNHVILSDVEPGINIQDETEVYGDLADIIVNKGSEGSIIVSDGAGNVYLEKDLDEEGWKVQVDEHNDAYVHYPISLSMLNTTLIGNQHICIAVNDIDGNPVFDEDEDVNIIYEKTIVDDEHNVTVKIHLLKNILDYDAPVVSIRALSDADNDVFVYLSKYDASFEFECSLDEFDDFEVDESDGNYTWYFIRPSDFKNDDGGEVWADEFDLVLSYDVGEGMPIQERADIIFVDAVSIDEEMSLLSGDDFIIVACPIDAAGKIRVTVSKDGENPRTYEKDVMPGGEVIFTIPELGINSTGLHVFAIHDVDENELAKYEVTFEAPLEIRDIYYLGDGDNPISIFVDKNIECNVTVVVNGQTMLDKSSLDAFECYENHWGCEFLIPDNMVGLSKEDTFDVEVTLYIDGYEPMTKSGKVEVMELLTVDDDNGVRLVVYPGDVAVGSGDKLFYIVAPSDAEGTVMITCDGDLLFAADIQALKEVNSHVEYEFDDDCDEFSVSYDGNFSAGGGLNYYLVVLNDMLIEQGTVDPGDFDWDNEIWEESELTVHYDFKAGDKLEFYAFDHVSKLNDNRSFTASRLDIGLEGEYTYIVWIWNNGSFVDIQAGTFQLSRTTGRDVSLIDVDYTDGDEYYVSAIYNGIYFDASAGDLEIYSQGNHFLDEGDHYIEISYMDVWGNLIAIPNVFTFFIGENDDVDINIQLDDNFLANPNWHIDSWSNSRVIVTIAGDVVYNRTFEFNGDDRFCCDFSYEDFDYELDLGNYSDVSIFVYGSGGQKTVNYANIYVQGVRDEIDINDNENFAVGLWCPWDSGKLEIVWYNGNREYDILPGDENTYLKFSLAELGINELMQTWVSVYYDDGNDYTCIIDEDMRVVDKTQFYAYAECDWFYTEDDVLLIWCPEDGEGLIRISIENVGETIHQITDGEKGSFIGFTLEQLGITYPDFYSIIIDVDGIITADEYFSMGVPSPIYIPEFNAYLPQEGAEFNDSLRIVNLELPADATGNVTVTIDGVEYFNEAVESMEYEMDGGRFIYSILSSDLYNAVELGRRHIVVSYGGLEESSFVTFRNRNIKSDGYDSIEILEGDYNGGQSLIAKVIVYCWEGDEYSGSIAVELNGTLVFESELKDLEHDWLDDKHMCYYIYDDTLEYSNTGSDFGVFNITVTCTLSDMYFSNNGTVLIMGSNNYDVGIWSESNDNKFAAMNNDHWIHITQDGTRNGRIVITVDGVECFNKTMDKLVYEDNEWYISPSDLTGIGYGNYDDIVIAYYDDDDYSYSFWKTSAFFVVSDANVFFHTYGDCNLFLDNRIIDFHISNETDGLLSISVDGKIAFSKKLSQIAKNDSYGDDFWYCIDVSDLGIDVGGHENLIVSYVGDDGYELEEDFSDWLDYYGSFNVFWSNAGAYIFGDSFEENDQIIDFHISDKAKGTLNISVDGKLVFSKALSQIANNDSNGNDFWYYLLVSDLDLAPGQHGNVMVSYVGEDGFEHEQVIKDGNDEIAAFTTFAFPHFTVNVVSSKADTPIVINVTAEKHFTGDVVVEIGDVNAVVAVKDGKGINDTIILPAGEGYKASLVFEQTGYYLGESAESDEFDVIIAESPLAIGLAKNQYTAFDVFAISISNVTAVNVTINGKPYSLKADGTVDIDTSLLDADTYKIVVSNVKNGYYSANSTEKTFTIVKKASELSIDVGAAYSVGDSFTIKIANSTAATVTINGKPYSVKADGTVDVDTTALANGTYIVAADIAETGKIKANSSTATFTISKVASNVKITVGELYGIGDDFTIKIANNTVAVVTINGVPYSVKADGTVDVDTTKLASGNYTVVAEIVETGKFLSSKDTATFTISKLASGVKITVDAEHNVGESFTIKIANNTAVVVTINGKPYSVKADGTVDIDTSTLTNGTYTVFAEIVESGEFLSSSDTATFTISKLASGVIIIVDEAYNVGDSFTIKIANNTVAVVTINGEPYSVKADGTVDVDTTKLASGDYTVVAEIAETGQFLSSKDTATFTISKLAAPAIAIGVAESVVSGSDLAVEVTIAGATGVVTINGVDVQLSNGKASTTIKNVTKDLKVEVIYKGDAKYLNASAFADVEVYAIKDAELSAEAAEISVGDVATISIRLNKDVTGKVTVNGVEVNVSNGIAKYEIADLAEGNHTFTVKFAGDKYFNADEKAVTVKVSKVETPVDSNTFNFDESKPVISKTPKYVLKLPADATGTLTVTIGGKNYTAKVVNGTAVVEVTDAPAGDYEVTVTYSGDAKYAPITKTSKATVQVDPQISAKDLSVQYSSGKYYSAEIYGTDGKKVGAGVSVVFYINGKQVASTKTNANGVASFKITQAPVTKATVTTKALGVKITKKLTITKIVALKKVAVKRSAKKLVITAGLKKVNGKYLKNKKITIKFNGKKYYAKTNKKGVAKLTLNSKVLKKLKAGKKIAYYAIYGKDIAKVVVKVGK